MGKNGPAVVLGSVPNLGSEATSFHTFESVESFCVSQLNQERLDAVVISVGDATGEDARMGGETTEIAGPKLGGRHRGCMDDPLICAFVQSGGSFESSHI